ncbi:MAG: hypothetical protein AB7D36_09015 [Oscillospiraceae bacterium]
MYINDFECGMPVVSWEELNNLNEESPNLYQYIGNHSGDDGNLYAIFSQAGAIRPLVAVHIAYAPSNPDCMF